MDWQWKHRVRHVRKLLGLSQAEASGQLGVNERTWRRWEQGETVPDDQAEYVTQFLRSVPRRPASTPSRLDALGQIVATSPQLLVLLDGQYRLVLASAGFSAHVGVDLAPHHGRRWDSLFPPEIQAAFPSVLIDHALANPVNHHIWTRQFRPAGNLISGGIDRRFKVLHMLHRDRDGACLAVLVQHFPIGRAEFDALPPIWLD